MSQSWNSGYVADIAYVEGFYIQQSPARMALACLSGNVAVDLPEPDDHACYLELGCGVGIGALLTAAANPGWQVTAIDYNPAHIAIATGLRASRAPRQYPLRRSRHLAAGRQRPGRRHSRGRLRQPARHVVVGQQRGAGRHRPAAGREDAPRRHGACELQFPAGLAGRNRHATTGLRGRPPGPPAAATCRPRPGLRWRARSRRTAANFSPRAPWPATFSPPPPTCRASTCRTNT